MIDSMEEIYSKLSLIDRILVHISADDLIQLAGADAVVATLAGHPVRKGPIMETITAVSSLMNENALLRADLITLKVDLGMLIKSVSDMYASRLPHSNELQTLKSKHNIY